MKLIQVNAWLGRLLPALLNFIDEQQPDIICAQEIQSSLQPNPLIETVQTLEYIKKVGGFKEVFLRKKFNSVMRFFLNILLLSEIQYSLTATTTLTKLLNLTKRT
jgi:exonuclease III